MEEVKINLGRLGFTDKEVAVYMAVLQMGQSRVNDIAEKAKVNRATAYAVLKNLSQRGLVQRAVEQSDIHYSAEPPEVILSLLELQQQELDSRKEVANRLVKRLKALYHQDTERPKIRYIETLDGLRAMQTEYQAMEEDIIQLVGYDTFMALYGDSAHEKHHQQLAGGDRRVRLILVTDESIEINHDGLEYVTISPSLMKVEGEMCVCGNRLVLFSFSSNIIAIEISSKAIAGTARASLELAWKEAQRWAGEKRVRNQE